MWHLVAFSQSQDTGGVLTPVNAVNDPVMFTTGADVTVPPGMGNLFGVYALGATITRNQIQSPSMRRMWQLEVKPLDIAALPTQPPVFIPYPDHPIRLDDNEKFEAWVAEAAAGAERETVLVWLSDGAIQPIRGDIRTIRTTAAVTCVAFTWTNGTLTFDQTLPAGTYQIVGMRAQSTNLIAARVVIPGYQWRPGVIGVPNSSQVQAPIFRMGGLGVWGQFQHNIPPTVDFLASAGDTSEVIDLDLLKVA